MTCKFKYKVSCLFTNFWAFLNFNLTFVIKLDLKMLKKAWKTEFLWTFSLIKARFFISNLELSWVWVWVLYSNLTQKYSENSEYFRVLEFRVEFCNALVKSMMWATELQFCSWFSFNCPEFRSDQNADLKHHIVVPSFSGYPDIKHEKYVLISGLFHYLATRYSDIFKHRVIESVVNDSVSWHLITRDSVCGITPWFWLHYVNYINS